MPEYDAIQGITPGMLWTALAVIVGLGVLYVLYGNVRKTYYDGQERKKERQANGDTTIKGQLDKIQKDLGEIGEFMRETNARFDRDNRRLNALDKRVDGLETGQKAQCRGVLALLNHELHNGNSDEMEKSKQIIEDYLIQK